MSLCTNLMWCVMCLFRFMCYRCLEWSCVADRNEIEAPLQKRKTWVRRIHKTKGRKVNLLIRMRKVTVARAARQCRLRKKKVQATTRTWRKDAIEEQESHLLLWCSCHFSMSIKCPLLLSSLSLYVPLLLCIYVHNCISLVSNPNSSRLEIIYAVLRCLCILQCYQPFTKVRTT